MHAIETKSLTKVYGTHKAVDDVSFNVEEGEIFGFLGPNGAGKSTTMMILTTLLKPTSGRALVGGCDVVLDAKKVRENIGYVQQETAADEYLTGRENLLLEARLNHIPKEHIDERIDDVLDLIELEDKQHDAVLTYSGGMRKRLDIAGGLLHRPQVLFLDEPTVGLDIQTRRKIWKYIKKIHKEFDMSIFLSTHYMEEADNLCERIGIIDYGKIQTIESPTALKGALGNEVITLHLSNGVASDLVSRIGQISLVKDVEHTGEKITVFGTKGTELIPQIFQISNDLKVKIDSISMDQPTLDDVFLSYTGHELRDDEGGAYNRRQEHTKMKRLRA